MRALSSVRWFCRQSISTLLFAAALLESSMLAQMPLPKALQPCSRAASQSAHGFYFQPEIIGEDSPRKTINYRRTFSERVPYFCARKGRERGT